MAWKNLTVKHKLIILSAAQISLFPVDDAQAYSARSLWVHSTFGPCLEPWQHRAFRIGLGVA